MNEIIKATNEQNIRKIEDIIDIQKAKGSFGVKQVAFNIPSEATSSLSVSFARSLESGLPKAEGLPDTHTHITKKHKRLRSKRQKSPCPDLSWPSGSDVTVLRLKVNMDSGLKKNISALTPGDGLHLPDSSSMVNLATLLQTPSSNSKHSMNMEEYLLPLSSWEGPGANKEMTVNELKSKQDSFNKQDLNDLATCSHHDRKDKFSEEDVEDVMTQKKMSKMTKLMMKFFACCSYPADDERVLEVPYMDTRKQKTSDR